MDRSALSGCALSSRVVDVSLSSEHRWELVGSLRRWRLACTVLSAEAAAESHEQRGVQLEAQLQQMRVEARTQRETLAQGEATRAQSLAERDALFEVRGDAHCPEVATCATHARTPGVEHIARGQVVGHSACGSEHPHPTRSRQAEAALRRRAAEAECANEELRARERSAEQEAICARGELHGQRQAAESLRAKWQTELQAAPPAAQLARSPAPA